MRDITFNYDITDLVSPEVPKKKRRWRRIEQRQIDIVVANADKVPHSRLGALAGISQSSVARILRENGCRVFDQTAARLRAEEAVRNGYMTKSLREMAVEAGVGKSTIKRAMSRLGLERPRGYAEKVRARNIERLAAGRGNVDRKRFGFRRRLLVRREYERQAMGMPQRTAVRLRPACLTSRSYKARWSLCRHYGYRVDPERPVRLLYAHGRRRSPHEDHYIAKYGFEFCEIQQSVPLSEI